MRILGLIGLAGGALVVHAGTPAELPGYEHAPLFTGLWGWMRVLCFGVLDLLQWLASLTGSWGLAIILVAVLVRLVTYPFARRALLAQRRFNEIQERIKPELDEIKRNYKGGEQSEHIIELYKEHEVSPAAGVKPLLIVLLQLPIFVALFQILEQAPQLRGVPFLWIADLSRPDQLFALGFRLPWFGAYFNIMPVLMGATILLAAVTAPGEAHDAGARKRLWIAAAMALTFFAAFYNFPAGLVLYWIMANLLHVGQQLLVDARGERTVAAQR